MGGQPTKRGRWIWTLCSEALRSTRAAHGRAYRCCPTTAIDRYDGAVTGAVRSCTQPNGSQSEPGSRGHTRSAAAGPRSRRATSSDPRDDARRADAAPSCNARAHQFSSDHNILRVGTPEHAAVAQVRALGYVYRNRVSAVLCRCWPRPRGYLLHMQRAFRLLTRHLLRRGNL